ncbi:uncharacterized protein LAJ45_09449 [Morchella importuna]|uniref:uncharacterized protein n=1 Tax=Morchella importuna TaxID=1174673 RepID=UPI001E8E3739|nr:uncharacterized protein LAJ45_09449 [Morchella importuna]KAH8146503.1 hypothetical protein LAJ45_09449 [Morchella importuna]
MNLPYNTSTTANADRLKAFALWAKIVIPLVLVGALGSGVYCCTSHRKQRRRRVLGAAEPEMVGEKSARGEKDGAGVREVVRKVDGDSG